MTIQDDNGSPLPDGSVVTITSITFISPGGQSLTVDVVLQPPPGTQQGGLQVGSITDTDFVTISGSFSELITGFQFTVIDESLQPVSIVEDSAQLFVDNASDFEIITNGAELIVFTSLFSTISAPSLVPLVEFQVQPNGEEESQLCIENAVVVSASTGGAIAVAVQCTFQPIPVPDVVLLLSLSVVEASAALTIDIVVQADVTVTSLQLSIVDGDGNALTIVESDESGIPGSSLATFQGNTLILFGFAIDSSTPAAIILELEVSAGVRVSVEWASPKETKQTSSRQMVLE